MKPNLEALRAEIPEYLDSRELIAFRGYTRSPNDAAVVEWDCERFPDYKAFVAVAEKLGVKLIVFRDQEFHEFLVEAALEDLEDSDLPFDDRRDLERRLREFRNYAGFTCAIEMTFEYQSTLYSFELRTEWYRDFQQLSDELDTFIDDGDGGEDEPPIGGYFSHN